MLCDTSFVSAFLNSSTWTGVSGHGADSYCGTTLADSLCMFIVVASRIASMKRTRSPRISDERSVATARKSISLSCRCFSMSWTTCSTTAS